MDFFERVKGAAKSQGTTIEYLANKAGLTRGAWNTYRRRGLFPRADEAVTIAKALHTTVEYLVRGEEAAGMNVPPRIASIVDDLLVLDDNQLESAIIFIHPAAELKRSELARAGGG